MCAEFAKFAFNRKEQKFSPAKNYQRAWQKIVSALNQNDYYIGQPDLQNRPQLNRNLPSRYSRKERAENVMRLYTPLDRADMFAQNDQPCEQIKNYESTRFEVDISTTKPLLRRKTDCITDISLLQAQRAQRSLARVTFLHQQIKRPLSSFQKQKHEQQEFQQKCQQPAKSAAKSITQHLHQKPFVPPSNMTAFAYVVMELPHIFHINWNSQTPMEMASLTKIMTCLVVLRLLEQTKGDMQQSIQIGSIQTSISGTSAGLQRGFWYSIEQLLYGLMLPSGNDASLALAAWGGKVIYCRERKIDMDGMKTQVSINSIKKREAIALFIKEMNRVSSELGMKKTVYSNPHGLCNPQNKSTAYQLALLCRYAMQNEQFRRIVSTQKFQGIVTNKHGECLMVQWENTHKLLGKREYSGIKTGYTTSAGSCLASQITIQNRQFIIIVLKCRKLDRRFKETQILKRWLMKKEGMRLRCLPYNEHFSSQPEYLIDEDDYETEADPFNIE